jgi:hypothetical protein
MNARGIIEHDLNIIHETNQKTGHSQLSEIADRWASHLSLVSHPSTFCPESFVEDPKDFATILNSEGGGGRIAGGTISPHLR